MRRNSVETKTIKRRKSLHKDDRKLTMRRKNRIRLF